MLERFEFMLYETADILDKTKMWIWFYLFCPANLAQHALNNTLIGK